MRSILKVGRIIFIRASVVAESLRTKLSKGQSLSVEWGALKVQELNFYSDGKKTNRKNNNVGGVNRGERWVDPLQETTSWVGDATVLWNW